MNRDINIDVDGVLYPSLPLEEYNKTGAFIKHLPLDGATEFVNKLRDIANTNNVALRFVTKTCSESQHLHLEHEIEKVKWLSLFMKASTDEICVLRSDEKKHRYYSGILIDDYGVNCSEWEKECKNNIAIQFGESKEKEWRVAENYNKVIQLVLETFHK